MLERAAGQFSVTDGPYLAVLRRLHLTRRDHTPRATVLVAIAWVPLVLGGLLDALLGWRPPELLWDLSVHVRLLVGVPLLVHAGRLLGDRCASSVAQLYAGDFAEPAELDPIVARAMRLRHARIVELAIAGLVVVSGQVEVWRMGSSGAFSGVGELGGFSFARLWYAAVALPLTQFLFYDWLWQWVVWTYVVVRVSRVHLATIGTHPDGAGGIAFLEDPLTAFAVFTLAVSTMMAAAWDTRVLEHGATPEAFVVQFLCVVAVLTVIAVWPLFLYVEKLYRTRFRDRRRYDELALGYVRAFDRKVVEADPGEQRALNAPEIRTLNALIKSVEHAEHTRLVPCTPRALAGIWLCAALPMIPLAAMSMPIQEVMKKLAEGMLAGLPI
jgi:hypothetical protein